MQVHEEDEERFPYLIVNGIRYVRPYLKDKLYSVRPNHEGESVVVVMAHAFRKREQSVEEACKYFVGEVEAGRIALERHKNSREDTRPFTGGFRSVEDPHMLTERNDRLRWVRHVHERCTVWRGKLETLWRDEEDRMRAVNKPAGLPVVDEEGGWQTVGSVMGGWRCGHRLDVCVSGVLLMAKGGGAQTRLMKALQGGSGEARKWYVAMVSGEHAPEVREWKLKMKWEGKKGRAVVVVDGDADADGTMTVTWVRGVWDMGQSDVDKKKRKWLLSVEIDTGHRHQIRCCMENAGVPIVGDTEYGGEEILQQDGLWLWKDDADERLKKMLEETRVDWCDKCRWQREEVAKGGSSRGTQQAFHWIGLHARRYYVPGMRINVISPPPSWLPNGYPKDIEKFDDGDA